MVLYKVPEHSIKPDDLGSQFAGRMPVKINAGNTEHKNHFYMIGLGRLP